MCEVDSNKMSVNKIMLLACGSYNPPTNMHLRMFEIARDYLHRMGNHLVLGGIISPVHDAYGKKELEASTHRLAMVRTALQSSDWIKLSNWECKQETWSRTKQVLQYHQNQLNALLHDSNNQIDKFNEEDCSWIPNNVLNGSDQVQVKLLCGGDLLESFGTPGLWSDADIESIVGQHGLVVITRNNTNPLEFIYNSDVLTKYMSNITIVTEWIANEVSSTKIRRALRRAESVKYLLPDRVIEYINKNDLYGSKSTKYLSPQFEYNSNFLTPSPSDITMESPSPTNNCMLICNNSLFSRSSYEKPLSIDTVDNAGSKVAAKRLPGQAVKIITESNGDHKIVKVNKEVCSKDADKQKLKNSKSCTSFDDFGGGGAGGRSKARSSNNLKECKSCDDNLIKFIFTKHGIQVISDVETIV